MPWTMKDAYSHTKKANTPELQQRWTTVANTALERGDDEATAIRKANATIEASNTTGSKRRRSPPKGGSSAPPSSTPY